MPAKIIKISILAVILIVFGSAKAQTNQRTISGTVKGMDGDAVFSAAVAIKGTSIGSVTNAAGYYSLSIAPGTYTLIFTHINFEKDSLKITVGSQDLTINRRLSERTSTLSEIQVTGKTESQALRVTPYSVNVIDVQPLQQRNLDLNKVLTRTSGVRVRQNAGLGSSFDMTLNGFRAAQFVDGIPVDVYGSAYAFNSIPINQMERIEIFKGAVPVDLSGDALGGAVNLRMKSKVQNNFDVAYSIGSFNTHKSSVYGSYRNPSSGFTTIGSVFFNYSDNSYVMKDMEIDAGTTTQLKDVRRFHDDFLSFAARAEVGITEKKFADVFLIGVGASGIRTDIQTGSTQYPPIGEATASEDNQQFSLKYRKQQLIEKIDLEAFALFNNTYTIFTDTASRIYRWDGTVLTERPQGSTSGEFGRKQIYRTQQHNLTQRYNLAYHISETQRLTLNVFSNSTRWGTTDADKIEGTSVNDNSSAYSKLIVGLAHDMKLFDERFQTIAFIKYYRMHASVDTATVWRGGYFDRAPLEATRSFTGGGLGISYAFFNALLGKASAEYACRLPSVYELLGDGIMTVANVGLEPELTMNYNLSLTAKIINQSSLKLTLHGGGFYRKGENLIRASTGVRRTTFINFERALVRGAESEAKLSIHDKFVFTINATYQQVLDDNRWVGGTQENYSYHVQLPNTPSLFANFDTEYKIKRLLNNKITVIPYYSLLYVRQFYLGYENVARGAAKLTIPMQLVHDIGVTVTDSKEKYSLSFECSNLTDTPAFDNFRLQKAGRAFSLKFTCNIL